MLPREALQERGSYFAALLGMSAKFDPYYRWLSIPPAEQSPDHNRLLGVARLESDPAVIENAPERQMAYVRTFQHGPAPNTRPLRENPKQ